MPPTPPTVPGALLPPPLPPQVLNKRLDIIKELFDMLASELHQSHSNKLEWIVIILIVIEVFFQVVEIILNRLT